jgi:hypothetical protein
MTRALRRPIAEPNTEVVVAVLGDDLESLPLIRAFRGCGEVAAVPYEASDAGLLEALARADVAVIAFATGQKDLVGSIKRSVMAGRHVFCAVAPVFESRRYHEIDQLSRRRRRVTFFDTGFAGDDRVAFLRKMVASPHAMWTPRHVRSLHAGMSSLRSRDETALAEIALACELMGAQGARISAMAPYISGHPPSDFVTITLVFADGGIARIDVAADEAPERRETVISCDGRTVVLDAYDASAPIQVHTTGTQRAPRPSAAWHETVSEHPPFEAHDRLAAVTSGFVAAIRASDAGFGNGAALAGPAAAWESARASMAEGGVVLPITTGAAARKPELRLIKGLGRGGGGASPALAIVEADPPDDGAA